VSVVQFTMKQWRWNTHDWWAHLCRVCYFHVSLLSTYSCNIVSIEGRVTMTLIHDSFTTIHVKHMVNKTSIIFKIQD